MLSKIESMSYDIITSVKNVFTKNCRVYISQGAFETSEIPTDKASVLGLIEGENKKFSYLGNLSNSGSSIGFEQQVVDIDFGSVGTNFKINGTLNSIMLDENMLNFASNHIGIYSILMIPDGDDGTTFCSLNGINITTKGTIPIVGGKDVATITLSLAATVDRLEDCLKFKRFES